MPRQRIYRTKRLELRALTLRDYKAWVKTHEVSKPKQDKFDADPLPVKKRTYAAFQKVVERHRRVAKKDSQYVWNIFLKKTGERIGYMDVATMIREPYQMANVGYFIFNPYRGQGYALEALRKLVAGALKDLKFHRLEIATDVDNRPSIRLAERAGLHREGIKKHYLRENGRWEDLLVFIAVPELFK